MTAQNWLGIAAICIIAYLLGSFNFAIILSKIFAKDDIRKHGSGNAGMTNILRTYGKWPAVFTAAGDFCKAVLAVFLGRLLNQYLAGLTVDAGYIAGIFVIIGHLFPLYFGFRGGKGVMAGLGVILSVNPPIFVIVLIVALPLIVITRIISIASIAGAITFVPLTCVWAHLFTEQPWYYYIAGTIIGCMILVVHRANIQRLQAGTENRLGQKKQA